MIGVAMLNELVFMLIGFYVGWKIRTIVYNSKDKINKLTRRFK